MATVIKTQTYERWKAGSIRWLGRQVLLIPEMVLLPLVFASYFLTNHALPLAVAGELLIVAFILRTTLLWAAGRTWTLGQYARAARFAQASLRIYPWSADGVALLATVRLAQGKPELATGLFERAIALFPGYALFHVGLSQALAAERRWPEARQSALHAIALDDTCAAAHAQMAQIALNLNEAHNVALQWVDSGLAAAPLLTVQALLYTLRADAALRIEQRRMAQVAIDQVTMTLLDCPTPIQAELLYWLGTLRRRQGDTVAACHDFERIAQLDPEGRWVNAAWRARQETLLHA
ncbi:MAG: tetratricopeptide repeat protein [Herpetosiphonaceae bacterium]|nr:tetratricopeptide repeat protein [Herpetosiphonaceae bacterium]